ncbi:uncharacterized protein TrAFT101_006924 [Trichoderma asperellum]|uniref:uncharacterized protein n=1 Tax=Trichoderma asperellum TaxID=101201 RepID=UPI0033308073|nr:hypothetical protein TrAFT101_006924 [Trichoderma asperellum]
MSRFTSLRRAELASASLIPRQDDGNPLGRLRTLLVGDGRRWLCRCNRSYCQCSVPSIRAKALEIEMPTNEWLPSAQIPGWSPEVVLQHANSTFALERQTEAALRQG